MKKIWRIQATESGESTEINHNLYKVEEVFTPKILNSQLMILFVLEKKFVTAHK